MAVNVVSFSFTWCSTRGPGAQFPAEYWLSLPHLISNFSGPQLIRGSKGSFGLVWPSLPHLVYNSNSDSSGAPRVPSAGLSLPQLISNIPPTPTVWLLSWLSYIIVQRPLNHPLNLWNGMFDRHQAEITVMQFTGHSLLVHHSEVGPSPCPILSAELTCTISSHNCHWNVSLPSGASLWMAFLAGLKVKIQQ